MTPYVSPSQLDTFLTCNRKWGFRYLDGIDSPPHRSAQVGTRVHAILEDWLRSAKPPDWEERLVIDGHEYFPGRIASEAIHLLPPPGPHLALERRFSNRPWLGQIDVAYLASPEHPVVMDHKTTTDLGWAKTVEELQTDPQAIIYAAAAFAELPRAQVADLAWTYTKTNKPYKAKQVHLRVTREYVEEAIRPFLATAARMLEIRASGARAADLDPTPSACQKYGGCPHLGRCQLRPEDLMRGVMNQMNLMSKIQAAKEAAEGAPPPLPMLAGAPPIPPGIPTLPAPTLPALPAPPSVVTAPPPIAVSAPPLPAPPIVAAPPPLPAHAPPIVAAPPPIVAAPPPSPWVPHPQAPTTHEWNTATNEIREIRVAAPPAPPAPPAVVWEVHPGDPSWEFRRDTGDTRRRAAPSLNAPEAPATEKAEPASTTPAPDAYDAMQPAQLKALAAAHGIDVKGMREKNLRIAVRTGMQAKGLAAPEVQAPAPGTVLQVPRPQNSDDPTTPRGRPAFKLLIDTAPTKTQGIVMTISEAFESVFAGPWRSDPANAHMLAKSAILTDGSLDGAVLLLRTGTPEAALLHDLLVEHALEVYGG